MFKSTHLNKLRGNERNFLGRKNVEEVSRGEKEEFKEMETYRNKYLCWSLKSLKRFSKITRRKGGGEVWKFKERCEFKCLKSLKA